MHIRRLQLLGPGSQEIISETFAEVEFGTEVTAIEDDVDGVRVTLATDGRTEAITAAYLLGGRWPPHNPAFDAGASYRGDLL